MPQMSPMSWTTLLIMFIMAMMIVNTMMYFSKKYTNNVSLKNKATLSMNWKW